MEISWTVSTILGFFLKVNMGRLFAHVSKRFDKRKRLFLAVVYLLLELFLVLVNVFEKESVAHGFTVLFAQVLRSHHILEHLICSNNSHVQLEFISRFTFKLKIKWLPMIVSKLSPWKSNKVAPFIKQLRNSNNECKESVATCGFDQRPPFSTSSSNFNQRAASFHSLFVWLNSSISQNSWCGVWSSSTLLLVVLLLLLLLFWWFVTLFAELELLFSPTEKVTRSVSSATRFFNKKKQKFIIKHGRINHETKIKQNVLFILFYFFFIYLFQSKLTSKKRKEKKKKHMKQELKSLNCMCAIQNCTIKICMTPLFDYLQSL